MTHTNPPHGVCHTLRPTARAWLVAALGALLLAGCAAGDRIPPASSGPAAEVAHAYGVAHWEQIERLDFTFGAQVGDAVVSRRWTWWPQVDRVTLHQGAGRTISYHRADLGPGTPAEITQADRWFINDSYWLLFPFQLVWSDPEVTGAGVAALPIGEGTARKVVVQFPDEGGYTPGDAYDLYLGPGGLIEQWVFRRGGGEEGRPATWERHARLGPILVSLLHQGPEGFRIEFTGVSAEVAQQRLRAEPVLLEP